ncbi:CRISPR-associated endoribonuclease Cas6 [Porphyromonas sp.]|uniref:CRISPR-associated endoribonuclease Cas6 n=1 Tax=Porphyromonas sp. TaxID=1924944 RepID=UPI0026DD13F3|nr:CRISPR-associated endoribonuclease Cas6 [Porphyromonas sp.]MDO4695401.1 CRISPR-associated endoribonuclease Cas6 [Porphyromonas sp.]MDO4770472.1 CRISPR-associated endoribonuclease Cas6 [Porphyromonas sp.]
MRIHTRIETNKRTAITFDHQPALVGVIHKWLGENKLHGETSLFSFSPIRGGRFDKDQGGLIFEGQAFLSIAAHDPSILLRLIKGIQESPDLSIDTPNGWQSNPFDGFRAVDVVIEEDPEDLTQQEQFSLYSPIFLKKQLPDGSFKHILYDHPEAGELMTTLLRRKMEIAGLSDPTLDVRFDLSYPTPKSCLISYKKVKNRASLCPVLIRGSHESKVFARNVGLGHSTGIGFGTLK